MNELVMPRKQKDVFLTQEGDAWFERNHEAIQNRQYSSVDAISSALKQCLEATVDLKADATLLEIGCGEGKRLEYFSTTLKLNCNGIEPSAKAVTKARELGLNVVQGTADELPYDNHSFDFLIFGFCLYLCDRDDLFRIAQEAHRVMKPSSWLIIQDFFAAAHTKRDYHHHPSVYSYKMDYRKLFDWHPDYTCYKHEVCSHGNSPFTDNANDWVSTSILRKRNQH
jgi:ubiquinone/menaquinone biosynthesis C-methylase UbiE